MFTRTILATVIVSLTVVNAHRASGDVVRPTPHELAAIAAAEGQRLWFHEEEFLRNPALRAASAYAPTDRGPESARLFPENCLTGGGRVVIWVI